MLHYIDLQKWIIDFFRNNRAWDRAISLDIEADLRVLNNPSEAYKYILSISVARRVKENIEIRNFILNYESIEDKVRVLNEFGSYCKEIRPLMLIGYGISRFDLPILLFKMRQLDNIFELQRVYSKEYWAFRDTITQSYILDIINPVRFVIAKHDNARPSFKPLEAIITHPLFSSLPFRNNKQIISNSSGHEKWNIIYELWKNNREDFVKYIEGDSYNTLLIAEELFNMLYS